MKIHAVVVEWPESLIEDPGLTLSATRTGAVLEAIGEIHATLATLHPDCMREFRAHMAETQSDGLARTHDEWLEYINNPESGGFPHPWMTLHEKEIDE